jgi:hypothetical protein
MIGMDQMVRMKPQVLRYAVVAEVSSKGYVLGTYSSIAEAQILAHKVVARVQINEEISVESLLNFFRPIESYTMNGGATSISQAIWLEYLYHCEVYVVPIDLANGGISQFVKERENCNSIVSFSDHMERYRRTMEKFMPFGFLAN